MVSSITMSSRSAAHIVLLQRRLLAVVTCSLVVAFLFWIIAVSTDFWIVVDGKNGIYVEKSKRFFLQSHNGLWKTCRTTLGNKTKSAILTDVCTYTNFFPEHLVTTYTHYQRTVAAFSIITIFIMGMGFVFSLYTFKYTRYMYKRLAASCHLISSGCVLVVLEVCANAVSYASVNLPFRHPPGSQWYYGYSYALAWVTFVIEIIATLAFLICSRKRKKDKAPNEEFAIDEEPTIIGR